MITLLLVANVVIACTFIVLHVMNIEKNNELERKIKILKIIGEMKNDK